MPNGRSGGFVIEKADLKSLVEALPHSTVVGKIIALPMPLQPADVLEMPPRPADALETARFIDECPNDRIAVEEQYHTDYIIHLSNEPKIIWLLVGSEAPVFLELRQRHQRWAAEHSDWNGWIAF
jgi:hypothetical protein